MAPSVPELAMPGDRHGGGGETPEAAARTDLQPASPPAPPARGPQVSSHLCLTLQALHGLAKTCIAWHTCLAGPYQGPDVPEPQTAVHLSARARWPLPALQRAWFFRTAAGRLLTLAEQLNQL